MRRPSVIYFIKPVGLAGPVKIGRSINSIGRLKTFTAWSPIKLEIVVTIPGSFELERNIHDCLARSHSHSEWFHPTDEVVGLLNALLDGKPIEEAIDLGKRAGNIRKVPFANRSEDARRRALCGNRIAWLARKGFKIPGEIDTIIFRWRHEKDYRAGDVDLVEGFISENWWKLQQHRGSHETAA